MPACISAIAHGTTTSTYHWLRTMQTAVMWRADATKNVKVEDTNSDDDWDTDPNFVVYIPVP